MSNQFTDVLECFRDRRTSWQKFYQRAIWTLVLLGIPTGLVYLGWFLRGPR